MKNNSEKASAGRHTDTGQRPEDGGRTTVLAWHFTGDTLRDGRPIPPVGQWLVHEGPLIPCVSGLHASVHPFDALSYASGNWLHRVEMAGKIIKHGEDKVVARRRRIIKSVNVEKLLLAFAREWALRVIYLWGGPSVLVEFLFTGDESIRDAAWDAAWGAARGDAREDFSKKIQTVFA